MHEELDVVSEGADGRLGSNAPIETSGSVLSGLIVAEEYKHHHAEAVLASAPGLEEDLRRRLEGPWSVPIGVRSRNRPAVPAKSLNRGLRKLLDGADLRFEATVSDGVIWTSVDPETGRVEGFDFAMYDERLNMASLWELCLGRRPLPDGDEVWDRFARPAEVAAEVQTAKASDPAHVFAKRQPTVLGEIQFGNWGLLHRDLMRLLAADQQIGIDLFVYITATGTLSKALSDSTVNFTSSLRNGFLAFASILRVPAWLIGLDLPPNFWNLAAADGSST